MAEQPPYSCILDGVQFVQIKQDFGGLDGLSLRESTESHAIPSNRPIVALKFHYTRRMAHILREEAERESRIQMEKEAVRAAEEEAYNTKYAIV